MTVLLAKHKKPDKGVGHYKHLWIPSPPFSRREKPKFVIFLGKLSTLKLEIKSGPTGAVVRASPSYNVVQQL